jgi:hypothetical protein
MRIALLGSAALALLSTSAAAAEDAAGASPCREITVEVFNGEPLMGIMQGGVYMKLGEGFEATCPESDRRRGCLVWRIHGRGLIQSNETPQRFFEIPAGVVANVRTQPTFRCEAGS